MAQFCNRNKNLCRYPTCQIKMGPMLKAASLKMTKCASWEEPSLVKENQLNESLWFQQQQEGQTFELHSVLIGGEAVDVAGVSPTQALDGGITGGPLAAVAWELESRSRAQLSVNEGLGNRELDESTARAEESRGIVEAHSVVENAGAARGWGTNKCKGKYRIKVKCAACHGPECCKGT